MQIPICCFNISSSKRNENPVFKRRVYLPSYWQESSPMIGRVTFENWPILANDWPGNIRELANAAERFAMGMAVFEQLSKPEIRSETPLPDKVMAYEKEIISASLRRNAASVKLTSEDLKIPRKTLQDNMTKYGLKRSDFLAELHP